MAAAALAVLPGRRRHRAGGDTAESTLVAHLLPDRLRGSGFGLLGGLQPAGDFLSSAVVGVLYSALSPTVGFAYAAGWMLLSVAAAGFPPGRHRATVGAWTGHLHGMELPGRRRAGGPASCC